MKKLFFITLILLTFSFIFAKEIKVANYPNSITVLHSNIQETVIDYKIGEFNLTPIDINGEEYNKISVKDGHYSYIKGNPELPVITKSIIIPNDAKVQIEVLQSDFTEFNLKVIPSKGKILRSQNPEDIPYEFSNTYTLNEFYPSQLGKLGKPYILRDFRGITVNVNPFTYNPITHTLRVYHHLKVKIKNIGKDNHNTLSSLKKSYSIYFKGIYEKHFINFDNAKYELVDEHGRLIVICYPDFMDAIEPYVEWKRQKGIDVQVYNVADIGNANQIKQFIQNQYDQNDDLTFVQLVGDAPQVPTLTSNGGGADPKYALVAGNDAYMDIFVGRFSAETVEQVQTQVQRTVWYERDIQTSDGDWIEKGTGIASSQGTGDDNEYDYQHMDVIRDKLLNYGYSQVDQLYDTNGVTAQDVANALNDGRGIVNYTGHGSDFSWASSNFDINNVNSLTNDFKLPFIQSVACVVGNFTNQTCFAESWLRATNNANNNPTGAIAFFGSSINQSWAPPMSAQDEYVDMITGSVNYNGTPDVMKTIGGLWFNGEGEMLDLYNDNAMSETWHIFGDASLMVRTKTPQPITVTHNSQLFIGATTFSVNTDAPGAQVCLYADGTIYASGYTNDSGSIVLSLDNPPTQPMTLTLTVTAYNRTTYIAEINVIPSEGAYVMMSSFTANTENGDDIIEFGEQVDLSLSLQNVGSEDAQNVEISFQDLDNYITFSDNSENFGTIASNQTVTLDNCVSFTVADIVQNNETLVIPGTITSNNGTWDAQLMITVYYPMLFIQNITINDSQNGNGNGRLDPGETADITITLYNDGGAALSNITSTLSTNDPYISINQDTATLDLIEAHNSVNLTFNLSVAENAAIGYSPDIILSVAGNHNFTYTENFTQTIGLVLEDFETGDFSSFPWEFVGNADWQIDNSAFEGNFCALSGDIDNSQHSGMQVTLNVTAAGDISFYHKVSSEAQYDFLRFYIDDQEMDAWSGDTDWEQSTYSVSEGIHTFKWDYIKDASVSNGSDCAWIDYIIFPAIGEIVPPDFVINPTSFDINLPQNGSTQETLTLSNQGGGEVNYTLSISSSGDRSIDGSTLECDIDSYTPGESYTLTFTVTNNSSDAEWLTDISIAFPEGVQVTGSTDFVGGSAPLTTNNETGDGVTVTWIDANGGYGNIHQNETATATVDIVVSLDFSGDMQLNWHMVGDQWGSDPHELDGQIILTQESEPITWISLSDYSGTVGEGETDEITVFFNSETLEWGSTYECEIRVTDNLNRNVTVIPVTLHYGTSNGENFVIPAKTELAGNYPNPFNPTTTIKYALKQSEDVKLMIFNLKGQLVKTLCDEKQDAGYHTIIWNGKDKNGKTVSSGVYFYKLNAGKYTSTKKMILMK